MGEAEKIAAKLTEAQRNALLAARQAGRVSGGRVLSEYTPEQTRKALSARGLVRIGLLLTPLGLEVRKVLERQS